MKTGTVVALGLLGFLIYQHKKQQAAGAPPVSTPGQTTAPSTMPTSSGPAATPPVNQGGNTSAPPVSTPPMQSPPPNLQNAPVVNVQPNGGISVSNYDPTLDYLPQGHPLLNVPANQISGYADLL